MGSNYTLSEMQEIARVARDRLKEMKERGAAICSRPGQYVAELFAYFDEVEAERTKLNQRLEYYEPLIDKMVEEDMRE